MLTTVPERPPLYVTYLAPSSTSLFVEWGSIPPRFENGIIRGFKVKFHENPSNGTVEERERGPLLNWIILDNLKKFVTYSIEVRAFTTEGYGPGNNITAITGQDGMYRTCNIYALLTKRVVKMAGYWPSSFLRFHGPRRSRGP